jgi:hypothetical protein
MKRLLLPVLIICIFIVIICAQIIHSDTVTTTPTTDLTPRISFWWGKVSQHVDIASKTWQTDPDGVSGADYTGQISEIIELNYCKKFYPNTIGASDYKMETITSWHDWGNVNNYTSTKMSYKCNQPAPLVAVLSPNKGEIYNRDTTNMINYTYSSPAGLQFVQIALVDQSVTKASDLVANPSLIKGWIGTSRGSGDISPFTGSYNWTTAQICNSDFVTCSPIPLGRYKILAQIKDSAGNLTMLPNASNWDISDEYFRISLKTTPTTDLTPRISYWEGKVNQHVDITSSTWQTDIDGDSGAFIDKLTYCKKFYPLTKNVIDYKMETITSWHDADNLSNYTNTKMSYKCVATEMCTDSDNGQNVNVAGNVIFNGNTFYDSCEDSTMLNEAICNNSVLEWRAISCLKGCNNGKCVK